HQEDPKSPETISGPSERAGFIEASVSGLDHNPARATYPPTATAESPPTFRPSDAVPMITLIRPVVRTSSVTTAGASPTPGPGTVAPKPPTVPNIARRSQQAATAPLS